MATLGSRMSGWEPAWIDEAAEPVDEMYAQPPETLLPGMAQRRPGPSPLSDIGVMRLMVCRVPCSTDPMPSPVSSRDAFDYGDRRMIGG